MTEQLERLLQLAKRGAHPGASGGEHRAFEIVTCLLEHGYGNDTTVMSGIRALVSALENRQFEITDQFEGITKAQ